MMRISQAVLKPYRFLFICNVLACAVLYFILPEHIISYTQNGSTLVSPHKLVIVSILAAFPLLVLSVFYSILSRSKKWSSGFLFSNFGDSPGKAATVNFFIGEGVSVSAAPFDNVRILARVLLLSVCFFILVTSVLSIFSALLYGQLIIQYDMRSGLWVLVQAILFIVVMRYWGRHLARKDKTFPQQDRLL